MRYLPLSPDDRSTMLNKIGAPDMDALFRDVPKSAIVPLSAFNLPDTQGELEVDRTLSKLAARNVAAGAGPFFCGAGAYKHHVPSAVDHLIQRSEFLTSYTPYQPEIAQGTLQYLVEFQTQVALLTGMEVANASLYDGSTATAEAVMMAQRLTRRGKAILSGGLHPHYAETVETELMLADLESLQKRLPALQKKAKGNDRNAAADVALMEPILAALEEGKAARTAIAPKDSGCSPCPNSRWRHPPSLKKTGASRMGVRLSSFCAFSQWRAAQMAPDLAMLVLIAFYIGLVIFDTISAWSIERKSRRQAESFKASGAAAPAAVTSFRTRTSLFMMVFELCLCGLMMGAVATWYFYATSLVQDVSFSTRWGL